ncbi:MAG TPA: 50S ribosomal protein L19 [bacterium]|nr:50S ribosomal protein L19 [bacterium]
MKQIKEIIQPFLKKKIPDIQPGDSIKVYQKFKEVVKKGEIKEKTQVFEGIVIAKKHGSEIGATITVRKIIGGVGVERIFPLHLPSIEKIEVLRRSKVRRAKLYFLRTAKGKRARLKRKEFVEAIAEEKPKEEAKTKEKAEVSEKTEEVKKGTEEKIVTEEKTEKKELEIKSEEK